MKILTLIGVISIIAVLFALIWVNPVNKKTLYHPSYYSFQLGQNSYNLINPMHRWDLPSELTEVSGISLLNAQTMVCVQDESGIAFFYDLAKNTIIRKINFGKADDYEAIEVIDDQIFVLTSSGNLYRFSIYSEEKIIAEKIKTPLSSKNDTEGLAYDAQSNSLLIACKGAPGISSDSLKKGRSIYAFHLDSMKLIEEPRYFISSRDFKAALKQFGLSEESHVPFKPSGIAIHPDTGDIVIICSVGKILIVINRQGIITHLVPLDSKLFFQPEGICFSPSGDLYIASEGVHSRGYILKF